MPSFVCKIVLSPNNTLVVAAPKFRAAVAIVEITDPRKVNDDGAVAVIPLRKVLLPSAPPIIKVPVLLNTVFPDTSFRAPKIEML